MFFKKIKKLPFDRDYRKALKKNNLYLKPGSCIKDKDAFKANLTFEILNFKFTEDSFSSIEKPFFIEGYAYSFKINKKLTLYIPHSSLKRQRKENWRIRHSLSKKEIEQKINKNIFLGNNENKMFFCFYFYEIEQPISIIFERRKKEAIKSFNDLL